MSATRPAPAPRSVERAYESLVSHWVQRNQGLARGRLPIEEQRVEDLAAELRAAVRTLHEARARLASLDHEERDRDLEAAVIRAMPEVADVGVDGGSLLVTTVPLTLEHDGARYALGSFRISISAQEGVRVFAEELPARHDARWVHPHVQADRPCFGDARVGVEKLLGGAELVPLVAVTLRVLTTYVPSTAYCSIDAWPRVL